MANTKNKIDCPKCGEKIDVQDILHHQVEAELKKKFEDALSKEKSILSAKSEQLKKQQESFKINKKKQAEEVKKQVTDKVKESEAQLKKKIQKEAAEEQAEAMLNLQNELDEKSSKIKILNKTTTELAKVKREKDELEGTITAKLEQKLNNDLIKERQKIKTEVSNKSDIEITELKLMLEQQKKLTEEMKKKQEQGSMQIQGEVQEIAIEKWLGAKFPLDTIEEIKKGERGADCIQIVNTRTKQNCGSIYYESKRTKTFQTSWLEKFQSDINEKNANVGVLVTEAMPSGMESIDQINGIWVCSYEEFKNLSIVLREAIIQLSTAISTQENKEDKMSLLYTYLTSNQFKIQIESIVDSFSQMKIDLDAEQRAVRSIWKKREKQLEKVLKNTIDMHGSIKGIAGSEIQSIPSLELKSDEIEY